MWIKKVPNGKIRYCERYVDYLTGKNRDVCVTYDKDTAKNRKEAMQILHEKIRLATQPKEKKELTLAQMVEEYRKDQKLSVASSTYSRNYWALESVKKILGEDVLVSRMDARYCRNKFLESGKPNGTLNEHLNRFKSFIRWAYKSDLVSDTRLIDKFEPFKDIPHSQKITDKYMESAELKALIDNMEVPLWALFTEFMALSGLRFAEAAALEIKDIDLNNKLIRISKQYDSNNQKVVSVKTQSSYNEVFIQPQLEACIRKTMSYIREQSLLHGYRTSLLFCDNKGEHIHYFAYNKYLKENTALIIGKKLTTHSLRHTHASLLFEQGFSLAEVSRRLRHSNSRITRDIYIHVTKKLRQQDAEKLKTVNLF